MGRWIGVSAAAQRLGLSRRRVRELIAEGKIRAMRVGAQGWWKIDAEALTQTAITQGGAAPPEPPEEPPQAA